jgi:hypothetical protein
MNWKMVRSQVLLLALLPFSTATAETPDQEHSDWRVTCIRKVCGREAEAKPYKADYYRAKKRASKETGELPAKLAKLFKTLEKEEPLHHLPPCPPHNFGTRTLIGGATAFDQDFGTHLTLF